MTRINDRIRGPKVRLIGFDGEQVGVISVDEALERAQQNGLDLVEVSPNANPAVCKIMDYGKFKYEQSKKEKVARKRQQTITLKEIRLRPKIEGHDFDTKARHARKFLEAGDKVKATVIFRGREMAHMEFGRNLLKKLEAELEDVAKVEKAAHVEGRNMVLLLTKK